MAGGASMAAAQIFAISPLLSHPDRRSPWPSNSFLPPQHPPQQRHSKQQLRPAFHLNINPYSQLRSKVFATSHEDEKARSASDLDVSVFRFTLGVPGFDESQLPRVLGYSFGVLLVLNHLLTAEVVTAAQMRSEIVGLLLAVVAINLPTIGKSLKGARRGKVATLKSNDRQVFALDNNLTEAQKEDLAWGSYALLRNTNTFALAIWYEGLLCARGCWEIPRNSEVVDILKWLEPTLRKTSILNTTTPLYLPTAADRQGWELIPEGVVCLLAQPFGSLSTNGAGQQSYPGFIILLSTIPDGYNERDKKWAASLSDKFSKAVLGSRTWVLKP